MAKKNSSYTKRPRWQWILLYGVIAVILLALVRIGINYIATSTPVEFTDVPIYPESFFVKKEIQHAVSSFSANDEKW